MLILDNYTSLCEVYTKLWEWVPLRPHQRRLAEAQPA